MSKTDDYIFGFLAVVMTLIVIAMFCLLGMAIYGDATAEKFDLRKDEWTCEQSHTETTLTPMIVGKVTVMMPQTTSICDRYERRK